MSAFPTSGPNVTEVMRALCGGLPGDKNVVVARRYPIWHRQEVAYTGATGTIAATRFTFFNTTIANFVTNLQTAGAIQSGHGFALQSIGIQVWTGLDGSGAYQANGALGQSASVTQAAIITNVLTNFLRAGQFRFTVGDKEILNVLGLDKFPAGRGPDIAGGIGSNNTAAAGAGASALTINNGAPVATNRFFFVTPWPLMGGQTFSCTIDFEDDDIGPDTSNDMVIHCVVELDGLLCGPTT